MTHDEIIEKARAMKKAMKWTNLIISNRAGVSQGTVWQFFKGNNITIYNLLDILDAMGLEINII